MMPIIEIKILYTNERVSWVGLILTARAQKKVYLMINNLEWIKWDEVSIQNPWVVSE